MPQKRTYNSNAERQKAYRDRIRLSPEPRAGDTLPGRSKLSNVPSEKRWRVLVQSARDALVQVQDEMDEYGSERSDAWHETERAERFTERMLAVSEMAEALENLLQEAFE